MERNQEQQSVVEACGVTMCSYNQARQCTAGAITVEVSDGAASCVTFTPRDGAIGIGSSSVSDRSRAQRDEPAA